MSRFNLLLTCLLFLLLCALTLTTQIKVIPILRAIMDGYGEPIWGIASLAYKIPSLLDPIGLILFPVVIGVALWKLPSPWNGSAVITACILVAMQLILQLCLLINFAIAVPNHLVRRSSANIEHPHW